MKPFKFLSAFFVGIGFFLFPISHHGKTTVLFDVVTSEILKGCPAFTRYYSLALILIGSLASVLARRSDSLKRIPHLSEFGVLSSLVVSASWVRLWLFLCLPRQAPPSFWNQEFGR